MRCRGVTWALIRLLEFCKHSYNGTEEEAVSLGEWEGWATWEGGDSTVELDKLRREETPSVAVFSYLLYGLHLLWVNTTLCDVYKGLQNTGWMKGRWRENSAMNTLAEVIMLQLNKLAWICPNWAFRKSLTAKASTPAWDSLRVRERRTEHIMLSMYAVHACMWRLLLNLLVNTCAGMTVRVNKM